MDVTEPKYNYNFDFSDQFEFEDLENRRLWLNDEVDECVITTAVYNILRYNRLDKDIPIEERKPIILYINSPGGSVTDGYALIDAIVNSKTPVYTVNLGAAYSMGFLIFIAGTKRFAMPHSEFLMHDGSNFAVGSTAKMKDRMDFELGELEAMTKKYIINHTKIDEDLYDKKYRVEWYFLPELAQKHGVVDYIVGVDCNIDEII